MGKCPEACAPEAHWWCGKELGIVAAREGDTEISWRQIMGDPGGPFQEVQALPSPQRDAFSVGM